MVAEATAAEEWDGFISDAAKVLMVSEEIHSATPAFFEAPFDETAQKRMREVLNSPRLDRASAAARRIAGRTPSVEGA